MHRIRTIIRIDLLALEYLNRVGESLERFPRKQPKQRRSQQMYTRILDASVRVLREEGALGFTTTRVADEADISVGSLYQYFPNKHALIHALHERDIRDGWTHVQAVLANPELTVRAKLHDIVVWFFATEAEEAGTYGQATGDIDVFLRDDPTGHDVNDIMAQATEAFSEFLASASTAKRSPAELAFAANFTMTTIESVGKALAARQPSERVIRQWSEATATMLANQLHFTVQ